MSEKYIPTPLARLLEEFVFDKHAATYARPAEETGRKRWRKQSIPSVAIDSVSVPCTPIRLFVRFYLSAGRFPTIVIYRGTYARILL